MWLRARLIAALLVLAAGGPRDARRGHLRRAAVVPVRRVDRAGAATPSRRCSLELKGDRRRPAARAGPGGAAPPAAAPPGKPGDDDRRRQRPAEPAAAAPTGSGGRLSGSVSTQRPCCRTGDALSPPKLPPTSRARPAFTVGAKGGSGCATRARGADRATTPGHDLVAIPLSEADQTLARLLRVEALVIGGVLALLGGARVVGGAARAAAARPDGRDGRTRSRRATSAGACARRPSAPRWAGSGWR